MTTVVSKANEISKWNSRSGTVTSGDLDLSELLHPDTFLEAFRQRSAREYGLPINELKLRNEWSRGSVSSAKLPVRICNLLLEGAAFDGNHLVASSHDSSPFAVMPACTLAWVPGDETVAKEAVRLPLYFTSEREKVVTYLELPFSAGADREKWILASTALYLSSGAS
jgi:dynein heavy chain 2